jgi:hypothetical protein
MLGGRRISMQVVRTLSLSVVVSLALCTAAHGRDYGRMPTKVVVRPEKIVEVKSGIDPRGSHHIVRFQHGRTVREAMGYNAADSALLRHAIATNKPVTLVLDRFGRFSARLGNQRAKAQAAAPGEHIIGPGAGRIVGMRTNVRGGTPESAILDITFQDKRGGPVLQASSFRAADQGLLLERLATEKPVVVRTYEEYGQPRFSVMLKGPAAP